MMTPEQFNTLVTKDDVIDIVRKEMKPIKEDVKTIMTTLDAINKTLSSREVEDVAHTSSHARIQRTVDNHEQRITKLETVKIAV